MNASIFAVTGATGGIGLEIARGLIRAGKSVVLVGRNLDKLNATRELLRASTQVLGDLGTVAGARSVAKQLSRIEGLDGLIHCAGLWPAKKVITAEGLEASFTVNHLAPAVLNAELAARMSRIVQVTAGLYVAGQVDLEADPVGRSFRPVRTYASTKLWNLVATRALARTAPPSVAISLVHPGVIRTALGDRSGLLGSMLRLVKRLWKSPEEGAKGPLALALSPEHANRRGQYFDELTLKPVVPPADSLELQRLVTAKTEALLASPR